MTTSSDTKTETATLAGGCFWCLEAAYLQLRGVKAVVSGYAGGVLPNPSYEQVVSGSTGHAETVQIAYNPAVISYSDLLDVFWIIHNPTTLNQQGYDRGTQHRSAIFYDSDAQRAAAQASMAAVAKLWPDPIVTELVPLQAFYPAESYHQRYFERHPDQAYCQAIINPKLVRLRGRFASLLSSEA